MVDTTLVEQFDQYKPTSHFTWNAPNEGVLAQSRAALHTSVAGFISEVNAYTRENYIATSTCSAPPYLTIESAQCLAQASKHSIYLHNDTQSDRVTFWREHAIHTGSALKSRFGEEASEAANLISLNSPRERLEGIASSIKSYFEDHGLGYLTGSSPAQAVVSANEEMPDTEGFPPGTPQAAIDEFLATQAMLKEAKEKLDERLSHFTADESELAIG